MSADHDTHSPAPKQALVTPVYNHDGLSLDYVAFDIAVEEEMDGLAAQKIPEELRVPDKLLGGSDDEQARRAGTMFMLADRLVDEGVLDGSFEDREVQHRLQKCVYVAQRMGANIGYEFDFLENGAFSTDLAVDICHRGDARGGHDAFAHVPGRLQEFLGLVREHTTEWLQVATFALRPSYASLSRAKFVDRVAWNGSGYDRKRAARVFDAVAALGGPGSAGRGV